NALLLFPFFFQAEDGIRDFHVTGVQTCALPISPHSPRSLAATPGACAPRPHSFPPSTGGSSGHSSPSQHARGWLSTKRAGDQHRSEERRVGKVSSSRRSPSRWQQDTKTHQNQAL